MEIDNDKVQDSVMLELAAVGLVGLSREVGNFGEYLTISISYLCHQGMTNRKHASSFHVFREGAIQHSRTNLPTR